MRILYIDIDSQRPDHFGCYGYHRNTTPCIDAIAREGIRFDNFYTSDAPCMPSRTALYSGRFGIHTGVVGHGGTAGQPKIQPGREFRDLFDQQGLVGQLQRSGLHTAIISPFGQRHAAHWFYAGFNEIHNSGLGGMDSAEQVMPLVDRWLSENATRDNWYFHVNLWDPHTPYRVPLEYGEPFAGDPLPRWLDDEALIHRHNRITGPHTSLDINMYDDAESPLYPRHPGKITDLIAMRKCIDGYDTAVRYVDDQVGRIVAGLKAAGIYDQTAIIVSGDHGENLGELGIYGEHATADQATCRIPMIIKWPGGKAGLVNTGLHYHLDLAPTLMRLLGREPCPIWDGIALTEAILNGHPTGRDQLVLTQCAHVCQRSVRWGNWLYMRTYHDGFRLFPEEMLFDLVQDPHEQNDLAARRPDICQQGAWRLMQWHDRQLRKTAETSVDVADPLWTVIREGGPFHAQTGPGSPLPAYLKRLEATGRADGAALLRAKYARFLDEK
ncbi:MAG: sulfatase [Phycisphaerae bacterium]